METFDTLEVPKELSRFIANWMTARSFRVRLVAPTGQYLSVPYVQNRGVPQGGVLSPLMWLILVNGMPDKVRGHLRRVEPSLRIDEDFILQVFADDISVALKGANMQDMMQTARKLGRILDSVLREIGLKLSIQKCKNFIMQALAGAIKQFKRGDPRSKWFRAKEVTRQNAVRSLEIPADKDASDGTAAMPYQNADGFKLLGLTLDNKWAFHDHMSSMQRKLRVRMAIVRKVSNSTWGLENRILTTTVHALVESLFNYGLTVTGSAMSLEDLEDVDKKILNQVARRVAAVGYSIRREVLYTLADIRSAHNHYLLKVANVLDRTLRAAKTQAQKRLLSHINREWPKEQLWTTPQVLEWKAGPKWPPDTAETTAEFWERLQHQKRWSPQIAMQDISWWRNEGSRAHEDGWLKQAEMSIFHAQAEEIRELREDKSRIFQYGGLKDWRDVAIRVLQSIGWNPGCVYEDTIYPQKVGSNTIRWDKITSAENPTRKQLNTQSSIEIFIMDWQLEKLGIAMTLVRYQNSMLLGYIQIMGQSIGETNWTQPSLALAASLT